VPWAGTSAPGGCRHRRREPGKGCRRVATGRKGVLVPDAGAADDVRRRKELQLPEQAGSQGWFCKTEASEPAWLRVARTGPVPKETVLLR